MTLPRVVWTAMLACVGLAGIAACGPASPPGGNASVTTGDAESPEPAQAPKGVIGVSLLTLENPFFKIIGDNITAEAKKHGYDTIVLSAEKDAARQSNQVKDFLVKKVAAIVLSPCESRALRPAIEEANQAGVPVFTVDIPCQEEGVQIVCQIATDNYGGGKEAGKAMLEALGEAGGKVAILHFQQAESCRLRVKGFREVIDAHNASATGKVTIAGEYESGGAKDKGSEAADNALQATPDLVGVFAINDPAALGARAALERANKADQVKIIGFDGQKEGKQAIKAGKIYADPIQFPDKMGKEVVAAFLKHLQGEEVPPEILIPATLYRQADGQNDPELK